MKHPRRAVADRVSVAFPIKVMGANVDGFVQAVDQDRAPLRPGVRRRVDRAEAEQRRQVPRRDDHRQRHQPRAARRAVPDVVHASDGQGRAVSATAKARGAVIVEHLGPVAYDADARGDARLHRGARRTRRRDELWLCEHPPVFTPGHRRAGRARARRRRHRRSCTPTAAARSRTTGPGRWSPTRWWTCGGWASTSRNMCIRLEQALLKTLETYGVTGHRVRGAPGVYVRVDAPFGHAVLQPAGADDPFAGPRQDRRARRQGQPALHLPRRRAQRRDGPGALRAHRPVRLCRAETRSIFLQSAFAPPGTRWRASSAPGSPI